MIEYSELIKNILLVMITSYFTTRLTLYFKKTEKWWDKKAETYSRLISAIYDAKFYCDEQIESLHSGKEIDEKRKEKINLNLSNSEFEIDKIIDSGIFYISKASIVRLSKYRKEFIKANTNTDYLEFIVDWQQISGACLNDIIELAKKELRVK
ncbi:MAG: hypothetical protein PF638_06855 [Candidatus Delongbacteria bacterium]|jgi:hypothetical protein|nr:hypothetical protein [Candidatus Delongbacteria bacterium]